MHMFTSYGHIKENEKKLLNVFWPDCVALIHKDIFEDQVETRLTAKTLSNKYLNNIILQFKYSTYFDTFCAQGLWIVSEN